MASILLSHMQATAILSGILMVSWAVRFSYPASYVRHFVSSDHNSKHSMIVYVTYNFIANNTPTVYVRDYGSHIMGKEDQTEAILKTCTKKLEMYFSICATEMWICGWHQMNTNLLKTKLTSIRAGRQFGGFGPHRPLAHSQLRTYRSMKSRSPCGSDP